MRALPLLNEVPRLTVEYLRVVVDGWKDGQRIDPTIYRCQFAFTLGNVEPTEADWRDGDWDMSNRTYMARGLFGPGTSAPLTVGDWVAWCRVISFPETPTRRLGILRIV